MRRLVLAAVVPLVLVLAGCGSDDTTVAADADADATSNPSSTSSPTDEPTTSGATSTGESGGVPELLDFTGTTVGGEDFSGASLAGTPTVLWFWAPWCPTCRSQVPQVEGLADDLGDRADVVGIGSLDSAEAIADFAGDVEGVTQLEDVDGVLWKRFGVAEQSSFVVLDADGTVAFEAGYGGSDDLDAQVEALLG